jgi:hypothetical protein
MLLPDDDMGAVDLPAVGREQRVAQQRAREQQEQHKEQQQLVALRERGGAAAPGRHRSQ